MNLINKFKVGDEVRCINAGRIDGYSSGAVRKGDLYMVSSLGPSNTEGCRIRVEGIAHEMFYEDRFELAELSMVEQIELARSYVGKTITWQSLTFVVKEVEVFVTESSVNKSSCYNIEYFKKHGFGVAVRGSLGSTTYTIPVTSVTFKSKAEYVDVQLNEKYAARIYKDKVVVGCQTFPTSILETLTKAHFNLIKDDD